MTVSREVELEILRLVDAEKLLPGTAASLVGVHHDVVDRVVEQEVTGRAERAPRVSKLAPYHGLLCETLKQYPTIGATRLATMARERAIVRRNGVETLAVKVDVRNGTLASLVQKKLDQGIKTLGIRP